MGRVTPARPTRRLQVAALLLAASGTGCAETIAGIVERGAQPREYHVLPRDQFGEACFGSAFPTISESVDALRAFNGPRRERQEVAVLVLTGGSSPCGTPGPLWSPFLVAVDGRTEALNPDPAQGQERRADSSGSCESFPERLRVALLPGAHVLALRLSSSGTTRTRPASFRGSTRFEAKAGHLYSVRACQPPAQKGPLFWVREETTGACVSVPCPEA